MAAHGARRLAEMAENAVNVVGIELLAAAQGCDFHAPLASSAPLERVRALAARACAAARGRPLSRPRHRGRGRARAHRRARRGCRGGPSRCFVGGLGDFAVTRRAVRWTGGLRYADPPYANEGTKSMSDWLTVKRGDAPLLVSLPHTGVERAGRMRGGAGLVSARAPRRRLVHRPALRLCRRARRHHRPHRALAHRDRRQPRSLRRLALSRPGHDRPVPTETFDGGRSTATAWSRRRRRSRAAGSTISSPTTPRSPPRSRGCARCIRASCCTIATRSAR